MTDTIEKLWGDIMTRFNNDPVFVKTQKEEQEIEVLLAQNKMDALLSTANKCLCGSKAVLYIGSLEGMLGSATRKHYIECSNEEVQKTLHCSIKSKTFNEYDDTPIEKAIENWNCLMEFYKTKE